MNKTKIIVVIFIAIIGLSSCSEQRFAYRKKVSIEQQDIVSSEKKDQLRPLGTIKGNDEVSVPGIDEPVIVAASASDDQVSYQALPVKSRSVIEPYTERASEHDLNVKKETTGKVPVDKKKEKRINKILEGSFDGLAIASFVCALAGLLIAGLILGILALIFGLIALVRIPKTGKRGVGLAIAGIVIGILDVVAVLVFLANYKK